MNLKSLLGALGASGMVGTAGSAAVLIGGIYLVDCRITAGGNEANVRGCYTQAILLMTNGAAVGAGYVAGYNTLNPNLKRKEEEVRSGLFGRGGKQ